MVQIFFFFWYLFKLTQILDGKIAIVQTHSSIMKLQPFLRNTLNLHIVLEDRVSISDSPNYNKNQSQTVNLFLKNKKRKEKKWKKTKKEILQL